MKRDAVREQAGLAKARPGAIDDFAAIEIRERFAQNIVQIIQRPRVQHIPAVFRLVFQDAVVEQVDSAALMYAQ